MNEINEISADQVIEIFKAHLQVLVIGLIGKFSMLPPNAIVPSLAEAFGAIMSEASATQDPVATLKIRQDARQAFEEALKRTIPAITSHVPMGIRAN